MPSTQNLQSNKKIAAYLTRIAVKALYYELALYPKPGLVSFVDDGSHKDMSGETLFKSLFSLRHYFYNISLYAIKGKPLVEQVKLGIHAERQMLAVTQGVNTHRGAIFALGIFCSTIARMLAKGEALSPHSIQGYILNYWSEHLKYKHHMVASTHGSKVKKKYQVNGAKEMAESGYQAVFDVYDQLSNMNLTYQTFGLKAYCLLLLDMDDTNILHRAGPEGLLYAKNEISIAIHFKNEDLVSVMENIHHNFCHRNISPGGVADMIGVLYFLRQLLTD
jgi:triphosphoribosyl-dephospho-CoA synthase